MARPNVDDVGSSSTGTGTSYQPTTPPAGLPRWAFIAIGVGVLTVVGVVAYLLAR